MLIRYFEKQDKEVLGCTGLVIGAGVGAGFTVFETFGYALNSLSGAAEYLANHYGGFMQGWILRIGIA